MALLSTLKVLARNSVINKIPVRFSGHDHKMHIQPSRFVWTQFKDYLHFYFMLGFIPLALISAYANIFIGDAELTEIPEGYTPHHWEYYKHPVTRFLARYVFPDRAFIYESTVSKMAEDSEKKILLELQRDLKLLMAEKADNKAWYYTPVDPSGNRWQLELNRKFPFDKGGVPESGDLSD